MRPCRDYLGGAKYIDLIMHEHPRTWGAGCFYSLFDSRKGTGLQLINKLSSIGCPVIRTHLIYERDHKYIPQKHDPIIRKAIRTLNAVHAAHPDLELQVSPFCEHYINDLGVLQHLLNLCIGEAKGLTVINNPAPGKGRFLASAFIKNELHSLTAPPRGSPILNFSYDGLPCVDSDVTLFKNNWAACANFFYWDARDNGKPEDDDTTAIPQRTCYPDSNLMDSIIYLNQDKGKASLPAKWIYKSHSENSGRNNPRDEMPVIISLKKAASIELKASNGQTIHSLKYYGTFSGGGYRYYATQWGYILADKAKRIQNGNPLVDVCIGKNVFGKINPAFREGVYRNKV